MIDLDVLFSKLGVFQQSKLENLGEKKKKKSNQIFASGILSMLYYKGL